MLIHASYKWICVTTAIQMCKLSHGGHKYDVKWNQVSYPIYNPTMQFLKKTNTTSNANE